MCVRVCEAKREDRERGRASYTLCVLLEEKVIENRSREMTCWTDPAATQKKSVDRGTIAKSLIDTKRS